MDNKYILTVSNVNKAFPGVKALDDVSIQVKQGEVHGIVGENGAGKSTLMKILSGVYAKDSGTIIFDGESIEKSTPFDSLRRGISIIYQEFNLVETMSVGENIFMGRFKEMSGMRGTHKRAAKLIEDIGSRINSHTLVKNLSTAEKQMVEIAKALSFNSKLIIMDEPSSSLTNDDLKQLFQIVKLLVSQGISVIYISHKLDEVFELCDTVTIMCDGRVIDSKPASELTRAEMIMKMVGRAIENEFPERPRCVGAPLLHVAGLNTRKLHDVSFTLNKGEILGLVGLVGAGRTEIARSLFGADKVRSAEFVLEGERISIKKPHDAIQHGIGFVPEDRKQQGLILPFSVETNISIACLKNLCRGLFRFVSQSKERECSKREIENLRIKTSSADTRVVTLSGGNQQKIIIGRWLEMHPMILILDEPTRGIDIGAKYEIYMLMKKIVEAGGSIILISSEFPEVLNLSNRVLTICDGKVTGEFDPEVASGNEIMDKVMG
ncbi:sugar ABC transporter ATP-binding protein [Parasphaerochaeta coccoides]|uniref:Monosaccharide-transporting ATPase n=1 Tax=Parasphaerochaeta coccoides (strain ATCC BAA-1237 / DSM 17374 / SPN1) TaxID=760011 RepID=F4GJ45_PARC1|nr:sugar ABC transporter ATP-binding protein [Parasphaerochaeta coccoides]AEC01340.1 Monosaccharide-transporting ATPase [Parasphaerochaeta coccoides DSM 17374]